MSFGTLYTHNPNPRSTAIRAVAKAYGLHLDIVYADKDNKEAYETLLKINPLGQAPTFVGSDGYVLTECIAIALYITSQSDTTTLLGSTRRDYLDILKWMSFSNSEFLPCVGGFLLPLIGRIPVVRLNGADSLRAFRLNCTLTDNHLKANRYLIGEQLTIADFFLVSMLTAAFMGFDKVLRAEYPSMTRWFDEVYNIPMYKEVAGDLHMLNLPFPTSPADEDESSQEEKQADSLQPAAVAVAAAV